MQEFARQFPLTANVIDSNIGQGLDTGCQVYISIDSRPLANVAMGFARAGVAMTPASILLWLSAGKPIAAVAIAQLVEAGLLRFDDPVARHIPAFAARGKEAITLRHLLMHTGGIRWANYQYTMPWEQIIAAICDAPLEPRWIVGETAGYHAFTSWYLLGEIIRRVDPQRREFATYARDEIFEPLNMDDSWFTLTHEQYAACGEHIGLLTNTSATHYRLMALDRQDQCQLCVPGASARGPAQQLGRFYEMLLRNGKLENGGALLTPESVEMLTRRHRAGVFDQTFKHIVDWGLGFIVNSAHHGEETVPYGFGPYASPGAFGHSGNQSSIGMADPAHRLAIAIIFNGMPGDAQHQKRMRATLKAIYEDLQLTEKGFTSGAK